MERFILKTHKTATIKNGIIRINATAADALKEAQAATGLQVSVIASQAIKWALERMEVKEV